MLDTISDLSLWIEKTGENTPDEISIQAHVVGWNLDSAKRNNLPTKTITPDPTQEREHLRHIVREYLRDNMETLVNHLTDPFFADSPARTIDHPDTEHEC